MKRRTDRHYEVLSAIRAFKKVNGYSPSFRDLMEMLDISSTSVVNYHLDKLKDEGLIRRARGISRSIELIGDYSLNWDHAVYEQRARIIAEREPALDGRKYVSDEKRQKLTDAARTTRGGNAFAPRHSRQNSILQERIDKVVDNAIQRTVNLDVILGRGSQINLPIGACKVG